MNKVNLWLESGVDNKLSGKSLKLLKEYLDINQDKVSRLESLEEFWANYWTQVKRADIHDMQGGSCFRSYLEKKVKNVGSRNTVLRQLERFFDFMIMEHASETGEFLENPVIKKWDNFQTERVAGTYRHVISKDTLRLGAGPLNWTFPTYNDKLL